MNNEEVNFTSLDDSKKKPYEMVNHPTHYNKYDVETVEMINKIWGPFLASKWCEMTAFKYRMRLGEKPDNPIEQDIKKENVYLEMYDKYKEKWKNERVSNLITEEEKEYIRKILRETDIENHSDTRELLKD